MRYLRWLAAAFSLYSRIPMPHLEWKDDDMACSLAFFPLVGAVIGAVICLVNIPQQARELPAAVRVMLTLLAPLLITGGFHLDGFMDTEDALRSYAGREKKLEILRDPHVGAFAVIGLIRCMLILTCAVTYILLYEPYSPGTILILASVFVTGRCLSALSSLLLRKARKDGMLYSETAGGKGGRKGLILFPAVLLAACSVWTLYLDAACGVAVLAAYALYTAYYRYRTYREFGGVTGDTAGHFLVSAETAACAALAAALFLKTCF